MLNVDANGNLNLSTTTATGGRINQAGVTIFQTGPTPSSNNLFFGALAGNSGNIAAVTSSGNVGFGGSALRSLTTGTNNLAFGVQSLQNLTTGGGNLAMGAQALQNTDATGNNGNNTGIGNAAGVSNTSGTSNVFIGALSGYSSVTTGSKNTFIGTNTGYSDGTNLTTNVSGSTLIGYGAETSQNNALILGGVGANAVNVGIGTFAPTQKLDITGGGIVFHTVTPPTAPTAALAGAGAGNLSNGNYVYGVTFVNNQGETNIPACDVPDESQPVRSPP